jgi:hypothetical protein
MASIKENYDVFETEYGWPGRGDEWSEPWGGTNFLWNITIFPRIQSFLPSKSILEIAPGFGRCTQFLKDLCDTLVVVDLSEKCIRTCQDRFHDCTNIEYHVNDGISLDMIDDRSIDFIFSWDSLVHVDKTVMKTYIGQFSRILKIGGSGFIHHSNMGEYVDKRTGRLTHENVHWRDETTDASGLLQYSRESGLDCILQEKVNWRDNFLNDCFSVITLKNSTRELSTRVVENFRFMEEASLGKYLSDIYTL